MSRLIADGQLAASSATLLGADRYERLVNVWLFNTSDSLTSEVWLTLNGRGIAYAELKPYESLYLGGLGMDKTSVLAGYATHAEVVNYLVSQTHSTSWLRGIALSEKFQVESRDRAGNVKSERTITATVSRRYGKVTVRETNLLEMS
jgi:hypothetical protein